MSGNNQYRPAIERMSGKTPTTALHKADVRALSCTLVQSTWWPAALFALAADSDGFEPFSQLLASAR